MYVCKQCHEQDAYSTGCGRNFSSHDVMMMGNCEICGSWRTLILCAMYDISAQKEKDATEGEKSNGK